MFCSVIDRGRDSECFIRPNQLFTTTRAFTTLALTLSTALSHESLRWTSYSHDSALGPAQAAAHPPSYRLWALLAPTVSPSVTRTHTQTKDKINTRRPARLAKGRLLSQKIIKPPRSIHIERRRANAPPRRPPRSAPRTVPAATFLLTVRSSASSRVFTFSSSSASDSCSALLFA